MAITGSGQSWKFDNKNQTVKKEPCEDKMWSVRTKYRL